MISYKALTRASITLQLIDDIGLYDSEIFSSNGLLLQPYDRSTTLTGVIYKNNKDITSEIKILDGLYGLPTHLIMLQMKNGTKTIKAQM